MSEEILQDDREQWRAEAACTRLINRFAHLIDGRQFDDLGPLMTDDCIVEWLENRMNGAELVAMLKSAPADVTVHIVSGQVFDPVKDDEIRCISYIAFYQGQVGEDGTGSLNGPSVLAQYHDRFRYSPDGWKISHRLVKPTMIRA